MGKFLKINNKSFNINYEIRHINMGQVYDNMCYTVLNFFINKNCDKKILNILCRRKTHIIEYSYNDCLKFEEMYLAPSSLYDLFDRDKAIAEIELISTLNKLPKLHKGGYLW